MRRVHDNYKDVNQINGLLDSLASLRHEWLAYKPMLFWLIKTSTKTP